MKRIIILFSALIIGFTFTSCGSDAPKTKSTHTHEDGTVHEEHDDCEESKSVKQESFKVEADSTAKNDEHNDHDHNHDHDHSGHKH